METELEQLRAENERLKFKLDNLGQSLRMIFFEQGIHINSVRGYSDLLLGKVEKIDLSETHKAQFLDMILKNALKISEYRYMALDLVQAVGSLEETALSFFELIESLLDLDDNRLLSLAEDGKTIIETSLVLFERQYGVCIDVLALHIGLSRIAHKLNKLGNKSPCEIYFSNTEDQFVIELSIEIQINNSEDSASYMHCYEDEARDWGAYSIANFFEGEINTELRDTKLVCIWSFPLIDVEVANGD